MQNEVAFLYAEALDFASLVEKHPGQLSRFTVLIVVTQQHQLKYLCHGSVICSVLGTETELSDLHQAADTTQPTTKTNSNKDVLEKIRLFVTEVQAYIQQLQGQGDVTFSFDKLNALGDDFLIACVGVLVYHETWLRVEDILFMCLYHAQNQNRLTLILSLCYVQPWRIQQVCRMIVSIYKSRPHLREVVRQVLLEIAIFAPHRVSQLRALLLRSKVLSEVVIAITLKHTNQLAHVLQKLFTDGLSTTIEDIHRTPGGGKTLALQLMSSAEELYHEQNYANLALALRSLVLLIVYNTFTLDSVQNFTEQYRTRLFNILSWIADNQCPPQLRNLLYITCIASASFISESDQSQLVLFPRHLWHHPTPFVLQISWHILSSEHTTVRKLITSEICALTPIETQNLISVASALRSFVKQDDLAKGVLASQKFDDFGIRSIIYCLKNGVFKDTGTDPSYQVLAVIEQASVPLEESVLALIECYIDSAMHCAHMPLWTYAFVQEHIKDTLDMTLSCCMFVFYALSYQSKLRFQLASPLADSGQEQAQTTSLKKTTEERWQLWSFEQIQSLPLTRALFEAQETNCLVLKVQLVSLILRLCPALLDVRALMSVDTDKHKLCRKQLQLATVSSHSKDNALKDASSQSLNIIGSFLAVIINTVVRGKRSTEQLRQWWYTLYLAEPTQVACMTINLLIDKSDEIWTYSDIVHDPLLIFRVDFCVLESIFLFDIFLLLLRFVLTTSRYEKKTQLVLSKQQSDKPGTGFRESHADNLVLCQETAVIQCLLEMCAPLQTGGQTIWAEVRDMVCIFCHSVFLTDPRVLHQLFWQTFDPLWLRPIMSAPSTHLLISIFSTLLEAPDLSTQVFLYCTGAILCDQYPLSTTLSLAEKNILPGIRTSLETLIPVHRTDQHQPIPLTSSTAVLLPQLLSGAVDLADAFIDVLPTVQQMLLDLRSRIAPYISAAPTTSDLSRELDKKQVETLYDNILQAIKRGLHAWMKEQLKID